MFQQLKERIRFFYGISRRAEAIYAMLARQYRETVLGPERIANPKKLTAYGFTAYSMHDDDGIAEEIFRRIGTTDRRFVEFVHHQHIAHVLVHERLSDPALFIDVCHFTPAGIEQLADVFLPAVDGMVTQTAGYRAWRASARAAGERR